MKRPRTSLWLHCNSDRGSLVMVMLVIIVGMGLAALMLPLVLTQTGTTTFDSTRGRALQAAESGLDIAVGQIRASATAGVGVASKLPCAVPADYGTDPTKIAVADASTGSAYGATIAYYAVDPSTVSNPPRLTCVKGSGVTSGVPRFATIEATGFAPNARTRTLVETYALAVADKQTSGTSDTEKAIWFYGSDGQKYCMTYIGPNSSQIEYGVNACSGDAGNTQIYTYPLPSVGPAMAILQAGGCLQFEGNLGQGGGGNVHFVQKNKCTSDVNSVFAVIMGGLLENFNQQKCINVLPPLAPDSSVAAPSCSDLQNGTITAQPWIMGARMGIRRSTGQIINGWQYSRCLTVQPDATATALNGVNVIAYSCAQTDATGKAPWQQSFSFVGSQLQVCGGGDCTNNLKCIASPGTPGGLVTLAPCQAGDSSLTWTKGPGPTFTYTDAGGRCLSLDLYGTPFQADYARAIVESCNGTDIQAWDVPESWAATGGGNTPIPPEVKGSTPGLTNLYEK